MITRLVKKCATCHGHGFTSGIKDGSQWTCPDCQGTGEECGHASPVTLNALTGKVAPAPVQSSAFDVQCSTFTPSHQEPS